jgi:YspA, cpYpsA-related SLOG family
MRILVTGDRHWYAPDLAEQVLNRLLVRYGPGLVIVHGATTAIDRSFAEACADLGIEQEAHPARREGLDHPESVIRHDKRDRPYNADAGSTRNGAMVESGAEMCLAFHRAITASRWTRDCIRRALRAGIPTYLIDSDAAVPRRLRAGDARLR